MTQDWLKIDDIVSRLEGRLDKQTAEQFHHNGEVRELLGAQGDEYPVWSLRYWRFLAEVRDSACQAAPAESACGGGL